MGSGLQQMTKDKAWHELVGTNMIYGGQKAAEVLTAYRYV